MGKKVETYMTMDQRDSSVAALSSSNFVVTWQSNGQDGSGYGVYGQIFKPLVTTGSTISTTDATTATGTTRVASSSSRLQGSLLWFWSTLSLAGKAIEEFAFSGFANKTDR